eukprot:Skav217944  [mRNA]  locus=scaffold2100:100604:108060:- [translate_table: standard]
MAEDPPTTTTKRGPQEGTPDREASARAKAAKEVAPRALSSSGFGATSNQVETTRVDMSAATIAALRSMMREELSSSLRDLEANLGGRIEGLQKELCEEREARQKLEQRIHVLELSKQSTTSQVGEGQVDKEKIVVGGFTDLDNEEAEKLVSEVLCEVPGFQLAYTTSPTPTVAFAQFDNPTNAMKFIRTQKFNQKMKDNKLWASENRSPMERKKCKLVSRLKKMLIEFDHHDAQNVVVSYKWFHVRVKKEKRFQNIATVGDDGTVQWVEDKDLVSDEVIPCSGGQIGAQ